MKTRAQPQGFRRAAGGLGIAPGGEVGHRAGRSKKHRQRVEWAEPGGILGVRNGLDVLARKGQAVAKIGVRSRGIRIEIKCRRNAAIISSVRRSMRAT